MTIREFKSALKLQEFTDAQLDRIYYGTTGDDGVNKAELKALRSEYCNVLSGCDKVDRYLIKCYLTDNLLKYGLTENTLYSFYEKLPPSKYVMSKKDFKKKAKDIQWDVDMYLCRFANVNLPLLVSGKENKLKDENHNKISGKENKLKDENHNKISGKENKLKDENHNKKSENEKDVMSK
ncbi:uncharacterized protein LOC126844004 isoform X1 [Adelges cooleyi]|uniref:uncharacterized protein LOC126844004 isoform X1 n=1 Tax=Adelges cooleyi TaxID=133065 RepID=UPI00217FAA8C|nr:uncharacterized protein LOC126844004 isoform X1 [Adelges cooleyi]